ncbi:branched-chain amino acid ABC transporter permease [Microbacterium sp. SYP-A9085]|jgi:branched-chain amino acid transport system permease protein|nr:branched-chain amino acid ABC transporter permease [Microbacterium sp. SYP-A9085]
MNRMTIIKLSIGVVIAVALAVLPLNSSPYINQQVGLVAAYAVALLGLGVISGHAGQVSLAQATFFGTGAYTTAIFTNMGVPAVGALVVAFVIPGVFGLLMAIPAVRLKGHALAMITLAVSLVADPLARRLGWLTGGAVGLRADLGRAPEWSGLANDQWRYYVAVIVAAVAFLLVRNMLHGKVGRRLAMVRTNEVVAQSMGIAVRREKTTAFVISAGLGGVGGFIFVYTTQYVSADTLNFLLSIMFLATLVIGGLRSLAGPVIGALFYVYIPTLAGSVSPEQSSLMYGLAVVLVVLFLPAGIAGLFSVRTWRRLLRRRQRSSGGDTPAAADADRPFVTPPQ